jgi:16S rRNA (guanine527-N7)-methyltransferase
MLLPTFVNGVTALGYPLSREQEDQFSLYLSRLLEWNQRLSLTAIREPDTIQIRHFLDSVSCTIATGNLNDRSLIDIGTGAGFPGVPLKILFPRMELTLVESVKKKTGFLNALVTELRLSKVSVIAARSEELGQQPVHREHYDWAVARGVATLAVLVEYLLPLVKVDGCCLALKGEDALWEVEDAADAIKLLGGSKPVLQTISLPERASQHLLISIKKIDPTPPRFPRRPGIPSKRPLR